MIQALRGIGLFVIRVLLDRDQADYWTSVRAPTAIFIYWQSMVGELSATRDQTDEPWRSADIRLSDPAASVEVSQQVASDLRDGR